MFLCRAFNICLLFRFDGQMLEGNAVFGVAFARPIPIRAPLILDHHRRRFADIGHNAAHNAAPITETSPRSDEKPLLLRILPPRGKAVTRIRVAEQTVSEGEKARRMAR